VRRWDRWDRGRVRVDSRVSWGSSCPGGRCAGVGNWDKRGEGVRTRVDRDSIGGKEGWGGTGMRETGEDKGRRRSLGAGRSRRRCAAEGNFIACDVKGVKGRTRGRTWREQ